MESFKEIKENLEKALTAYHDQMDLIARRGKELDQLVSEDKEKLAALQQSYKDAMTNLDEVGADKLFDQIEEVTKRIRNNFQKLGILQSSDPLQNPAIKKIANDYVEATAPLYSGVDEAFTKKAAEVEAAQKEYIKKLIELDDLNHFAESYEADFEEIARKADQEVCKKHNVIPRIGMKKFKKVSHKAFFIGNHNYAELRKGN